MRAKIQEKISSAARPEQTENPPVKSERAFWRKPFRVAIIAAVTIMLVSGAALAAVYWGDFSKIPLDLTFTEYDVPELLDRIAVSQYEAVYLDSSMCLRVTKEGVIQKSSDNGATWNEITSDAVDAQEYAVWLRNNDPNPGYSAEELQSRLLNGADVKYCVFENGNETYITTDADGAHIELAQSSKEQSVLVDGMRMMITSVGINPHVISTEMLRSFYDLLASCGIISETEAEQGFADRIAWIENAGSRYFRLEP